MKKITIEDEIKAGEDNIQMCIDSWSIPRNATTRDMVLVADTDQLRHLASIRRTVKRLKQIKKGYDANTKSADSKARETDCIS